MQLAENSTRDCSQPFSPRLTAPVIGNAPPDLCPTEHGDVFLPRLSKVHQAVVAIASPSHDPSGWRRLGMTSNWACLAQSSPAARLSPLAMADLRAQQSEGTEFSRHRQLRHHPVSSTLDVSPTRRRCQAAGCKAPYPAGGYFGLISHGRHV